MKIRDYTKLKENQFYLVTDSLGDSYLLFYRGFHYNKEVRDIVLVFWSNEKGDGLTEWFVDELQEAIHVPSLKGYTH